MIFRMIAPGRLLRLIGLLAAVELIALFGPAALSPSAPAAAGPETYSCPDRSSHLASSSSRGFDGVREAAPSAGARSSADLYALTRHATAAYDMYDAFARGEDPLAYLPSDLHLVGVVYGDPGRNTERPSGRSGPKLRDGRTFYGFVADEPSGRRVIALRGTVQPNEWLRNLQARMQPYPIGTRRSRAIAWVHRGFGRIFRSLRIERDGESAALVERLPELTAQGETVFLGHSLGGALAVLAGVEAARLSPDGGPRLRVVTFGAPRVGDEGFADMARAVGRIDRVCNLPDLVAGIPPSTSRFAYVHVGEVFRVSSFDWPELNNDMPERGAQIACWHSVLAYAYMTKPGAKIVEPAFDACRR